MMLFNNLKKKPKQNQTEQIGMWRQKRPFLFFPLNREGSTEFYSLNFQW